MSDTIAIHPHVPLDLHPEAISNHAKALGVEDTVGRHILRAGREALTAMYAGYGKMEDAQRACLAAAEPAGYTPGEGARGKVRLSEGRLRVVTGREAEFAAAARAAFDRAAATIDNRKTELEGYRDQLAKRITAALFRSEDAHPQAIAQAGEIRAHMKGEKQRFRLLVDAIEAGDRQTVAAVLAAPPYLSGLTPKQHSELRGLAERKFAPTETAQRDAADAIIAHVMKVASVFVGRLGEALKVADTPAGRATAKIGELANG